jgi:DNA repair protein RecO (recombination protein O)
VPQERTEAIVVRGVDFSESSRIVTLLTPARGRVSCIAKGARRPKSPLAAILDPFNRVEVVYYWKEGRAVQPLGEAALLDAYEGIKIDLEKAAFAAFPLELAFKAVHENDPSEALFKAVAQGLETLATWRGNVRGHACWQVWRLLCAAGFEPTRDRCVGCGGAVNDAPGFSYEGGVTCRACRADRRLSVEALAALRALGAEAATSPTTDVSTELFSLLRHYAVRQIEVDFRSVRVIDELFG